MKRAKLQKNEISASFLKKLIFNFSAAKTKNFNDFAELPRHVN